MRTSQPLRVGVVGFGSMGQWMAEALAQVPGLALAGVADPDASARQAAQLWGLPAYADYQQLLGEPLDGVYIATPNAQHSPVVRAAAACGLGLFVEKPLALTVPEADEMLQAVQQAGVPALVNFSWRFSAPQERLRRLLEDGRLGTLLLVWARSHRGYGLWANGVRHPAVQYPEVSGGWVIHHAIHGLDWLLWVGGAVRRVAAATFRSTPEAPGPEGVTVQLEFHSGAIGQLTDSAGGYREQAAGLLGSRGTAVFGGDGRLRFVAEPAAPEAGHELTGVAEAEGQRHVAAHHFAAVLRGEAQPRATLEDGRAALQLATAVLAAAEHGRSVMLADYQTAEEH